LENDQPAKKIILSASVNKGRFGLNIRNTLFGNTATTTINVADTAYENFSSKIITDLSFIYSPKSWITITTGANNIFNVYPDPIRNYQNTAEGTIIYSRGASPFGYNGGYYFVSMAFKW
jgi:iron complex outermembrane recepter protein